MRAASDPAPLNQFLHSRRHLVQIVWRDFSIAPDDQLTMAAHGAPTEPFSDHRQWLAAPNLTSACKQ
jgi:hypothetical protein